MWEALSAMIRMPGYTAGALHREIVAGSISEGVSMVFVSAASRSLCMRQIRTGAKSRTRKSGRYGLRDPP